MENKVNSANFNTLDKEKFDKAIRSVENAMSECNKLLNDLKDNGLSSFITFDIALSIIKDGREGIKTLTNDVIKEAQSRVLLTKEKEDAKANYTKFFEPYLAKADIVRRVLYAESQIFDLNIFVWNNDSKEIGLIKGYKAKLEPLFTLEAKDYHYAYLEFLQAYAKAKSDLYRYHALVYAHDYPTHNGNVRRRGYYSDDAGIRFNPDTLEYTAIELDKLLLTGMHEPDDESILKAKIY